MQIMKVRPSIEKSYERRFHAAAQDIDEPKFFLPMRGKPSLQDALQRPRLARAIGVIYRPVLPRQFDEYIWFDETRAVSPLPTVDLAGMPDTYPFGL
jgi:protein-L-isoaspartate(D-aspartate) O-methyltransferase